MFGREQEVIGIINQKVGDKVREHYHHNGVVTTMTEPLEGTVVYVHPCGRFYTVEFDFFGRKVRESYTIRSDINPTRIPWAR